MIYIYIYIGNNHITTMIITVITSYSIEDRSTCKCVYPKLLGAIVGQQATNFMWASSISICDML